MVNQKYNAKEILEYLKSHTYIQTSDKFGISEMQITRIKKKGVVLNDLDYKTAITELYAIISKMKNKIEQLPLDWFQFEAIIKESNIPAIDKVVEALYLTKKE